MMSSENVRDIREILASIEALSEEADCLNRTGERENNGPEHESLPASLVAEMGARKADVVLLDEVYRKGTSQQELKPDVPARTGQQKTKSEQAPGLKSKPSDAEFDQMLSTLMKDMELHSKKTGAINEPRIPDTGKMGARGSSELKNLRADIDGLLSPYLNTSATPKIPQPIPASNSQNHEGSEDQVERQRRVRQKDLSDAPLLSIIMTDDMRAEIANYILAEIKQQISNCIAENLENIVEDALRSLSTEARDALEARSVR